MKMGLSIPYCEGLQVIFSKLLCFYIPEDWIILTKHADPEELLLILELVDTLKILAISLWASPQFLNVGIS